MVRVRRVNVVGVEVFCVGFENLCSPTFVGGSNERTPVFVSDVEDMASEFGIVLTREENIEREVSICSERTEVQLELFGNNELLGKE